MNPLLWVFEFVFRCRHRQLSRVFTIKQRTYKVCFQCGRESECRKVDASASAGRLCVALQGLKKIESLTGGPLKPDFGLSGAVLPLDKVFPPLVRLFVSSIPTRSRPVPYAFALIEGRPIFALNWEQLSLIFPGY